jgi:hypothetical protein
VQMEDADGVHAVRFLIKASGKVLNFLICTDKLTSFTQKQGVCVNLVNLVATFL